MTKQKIILLIGLPGSGKTTWSTMFMESNPNFRRINKDTIREEEGNPSWSREFEKRVLETERSRGEMYLLDGYSLIVDDTNFADKHSKYWMDIAKKYNCEYEEKFLDVSVDLCIERDALREKPVGEAVIRKMYNQYVKKNSTKKDDRFILRQNKFLPKCIIVDIDGTVALINDRNPYDDSKIHTDLPNCPVINLVKKFKTMYDFDHMESDGEVQNKIIFMSGRMDKCRQETTQWLNSHNIPFDHLYMRETNDYRGDSIVKRELYDKFIKDKYYVEAIFDDRDQVVSMWRELGLLCCQVYYGNF